MARQKKYKVKVIFRISLTTSNPIAFFPEKVGSKQLGLTDEFLPYMLSYCKGQFSTASLDYLSDRTRAPVFLDGGGYWEYRDLQKELEAMELSLDIKTRLSGKMRQNLIEAGKKRSNRAKSLPDFIKELMGQAEPEKTLDKALEP